MVIPHAEIPISSIRPTDILLLLTLGTATELLHRLILRSAKIQNPAEQSVRSSLRLLQYKTMKKRNLGPSAFVETSKLERQVLAKEKELAALDEERKARGTRIEKKMKYVMMVINFLVFLMYYGIPLLTIDGLRLSLSNPDLVSHVKSAGVGSGDGSSLDAVHAAVFWKGVLFPISSLGIAIKASKIGLVEKASSVSALVVYWSAQTMAGKVYECVEALAFR